MNEIEISEVHFIDDSPDEHMLTRMMLRRSKLPIELSTHYDYGEFDAVRQATPHKSWDNVLVVFDLNLTISSGLDAIKALRSEIAYENVIAGICTGSEDPKDRKDALEAGADFFVTKPLNAATLEKICHSVPVLDMVTDDASGKRLIRYRR